MKRILIITSLVLLSALAAVAGPKRGIILRVQFKDVSFTSDDRTLQQLADSASLYFSAQACFQDGFKFDLGPVITLGENMAYYGKNGTMTKDERLYQAVIQACLESDDAIDFSNYDNNNDGTVDNVTLLTAGYSEAQGGHEDCIWPQQGFLRDYGAIFALDWKEIDCFSITTEHSGLLTLCHEFAHTLGLPDLYDTDGSSSGGTSAGIRAGLSLMDNELTGRMCPPNMGAVEMHHLGIGSGSVLEEGEFILRPVGKSRSYIKLETEIEGEYFLLECRDGEGWDKSAACKGMIVYHIDKSDNDAGYSTFYRKNMTASERWSLNQVNCRPDRQCAAVVPAVEGPDDRYVSFPQQGVNTLSSGSNAAFRTADGGDVPFVLSDITALEDGSIRFSAYRPLFIEEVDVFQDAATICWSQSEKAGPVASCTVRWFEAGSKVGEMAVEGKSFCTIEKLSPDTSYSATITVTYADGNTFSANSSFTTKKYREQSRPYMILPASGRNSDGSFLSGARIPLRIANAPDAIKVRWFSDGSEISPDRDGHYSIRSSCTLRAEMENRDGSVTIFVKNVTVR